MDESTQTQPEPGDQPELPRGLAGVAQLLRDNPDTIGRDDDDPEPPEIEGGEQPLLGMGSAKDPKDNTIEDDPGLSEDGLGMQPEKGAGAGDSDDDPVSLPLQQLAEQAGLTLDELFKIVVPLDAGEQTTLGALKDQFKDYSRLAETQLEFDEGRTKFENDMIRARAELQEVIKLLPEIPPAVLERAQQVYQQTRAAEHESLLAIKPAWSDPTVFNQAQDDIMSTVAEYGFSRADLDSVFDHRLTKMLHDFHTMRQRFAEANAGAKRVVKQSRQRRTRAAKGVRTGALKEQSAEARASSRTDVKVKGVAALLNQG